MPKIYWTTIVASMSLAFWLVYLLFSLFSTYHNYSSIGLTIVFLLNLLGIIIVREKTY